MKISKLFTLNFGSWAPKVPNGETPIDPIPYPNDPKIQLNQELINRSFLITQELSQKYQKDPTKPFDPDINPLVPLTPVDPKDPSKGYEVPTLVPTEPGKILKSFTKLIAKSYHCSWMKLIKKYQPQVMRLRSQLQQV